MYSSYYCLWILVFYHYSLNKFCEHTHWCHNIWPNNSWLNDSWLNDSWLNDSWLNKTVGTTTVGTKTVMSIWLLSQFHLFQYNSWLNSICPNKTDVSIPFVPIWQLTHILFVPIWQLVETGSGESWGGSGRPSSGLFTTCLTEVICSRHHWRGRGM